MLWRAWQSCPSFKTHFPTCGWSSRLRSVCTSRYQLKQFAMSLFSCQFCWSILNLWWKPAWSSRMDLYIAFLWCHHVFMATRCSVVYSDSSASFKSLKNSPDTKQSCPVTALQAPRERGDIAPTHSWPRYYMRWVINVAPRALFTPGERTPGTYWRGGWVGLKSWSGHRG
jgi:hypothetical protein